MPWETPAVRTDQETNAGEIVRDAADGRHTYALADYADAGAALNQALSDADSSLGTHIVLPMGGHDIGETVTIPPTLNGNAEYKPWTIKGRGGSSTGQDPLGSTLKSTISDGSDVITTQGKPYAARLSYFTVVGNGSEGNGVVHNGPDVSFPQFLNVVGVGGDAYVLTGLETDYISLTAKMASRGGRGFRIEADDARFIHCQADGVTSSSRAMELATVRNGFFFHPETNKGQEGLYVNQNCENIIVRAGKHTLASNEGVFWRPGLGSSRAGGILEGCKIANNSGGALYVGAEDSSIIGNQLDDDSEHIEISNNAKRILFANNTFEGSGTDYNIDSAAIDITILDAAYNGEVRASPPSSTYTLNFDTVFSSFDVLDLAVVASDGTTSSGSSGTAYGWKISGYSLDSNGNIASVDVTFFDDTFSTVNPSDVTWKATATNAGYQ